MRQFLSRHEIGKTEGFRWRGGGEISRIEGLSDAVFAFAVTLLVVSLEVPKTFDELMENMHGFLGFAAAFTVLFLIWLNQYKFFRRYGLEDGPTLWLNALLMFLVLFFVYPLKFLFSLLFHLWTGGANQVKLATGQTVPIIHEGQESLLMMIYAGGYIAVFFVFGMLYWRAYRKRGSLELSASEVFETIGSLWEMGIQVSIGSLALALAAKGEPGWSGISFCLVGPAITGLGFWRGSLRRRTLPAAANK